MQPFDIQYMNGAVLHSNEAGRLQLMEGAARDLSRQATQACDLFLR